MLKAKPIGKIVEGLNLELLKENKKLTIQKVGGILLIRKLLKSL